MTAQVEFSGYLPNGIRTFYTIPLDEAAALAALAGRVADVVALTNAMIAAGLAFSDPRLAALEVGEQRDSVGYVIRYDKVSKKTGRMSHWIGLYPDTDGATKKYLWVYLDEPEQIADFEAATGVTLESMNVWPTNQAPERTDAMAQFIVKVKPGVNAIYKPNPDWVDEVTTKFEPKRIFVRWESATPTPPAAAAPAPSTATGEAAVSDGDDWEANERRKAVTALNNEMITIFKVRYQPTQNGVGVERWIATANVLGGGSVPVVVYGEDAGRITKEGYVWPKTDGDNLSIPVITEMRGSDRRITHVEPANANVALIKATFSEDEQKIIMDFMAQPIAKAWKQVREWLLIHVYENKFHMDKSIEKWGKETSGWKGMNAGEVMSYLEDRHKAEKQAS